MEIVENKKEYLTDFIRLNEEWISSYFVLEDTDYVLAKKPYQIIENGGYIFSLLLDGNVVGVCALFNEGNSVFELARMAVSPSYQSNGYGQQLMLVCMAKLSDIGAKKVYLVSNTKLEAAITLYKNHGFQTISEGQSKRYSRANIIMECLLD